MRLFRLALTMLRAKFRTKLNFAESSILPFRVWLTDVDVRIMNHATMMTVMEMGRIDYMVRTGFFASAMKNKWFYPAGAISVQFLRPLKVFQTAQVETRLFHMDENWLHIEHRIVRNGKVMALAILKGTIKKGRGRVPLSVIMDELGIQELPQEGKEIIDAFKHECQLVLKKLDKDI